MAGQTEALTVVGYRVKTESIQQAVQGANAVSQAFAGNAAAANRAAVSFDTAEQAAAELGVDVRQLTGDTEKLATKTAAAGEKIAASYDKVASSAGKAARAQSSGVFGGVASGFGTVRSLAGAAGMLAGNSAAGSAIAAFSGLSVELGPFGVVAAGAALAVNALTREYEANAAAAKEGADALKGRADLVAGGATSAEVQAQIDRLKAGRGVVDRQLADVNALRELARRLVPDNNAETAARLRQSASLIGGGTGDPVFLQMQSIFNSISKISGVNVQDFQQLQAGIEAVTQKSIDYGREILNLNTLLVSGQLEANNAAAALEKTNEALAHTNALSNAVAEGLKRGAEMEALRNTQYDNYLAALDTELQIRDELTATLAKMNEIRAERDTKLLELQADTAEKRQEIEAEAADRLQQIALESTDRINKILRDAGREQLNAVGRRDVEAFLMSKQRQKDAVDDQQLADKRATEQLAKKLTKDEAQLDRSFRKQADQLYNATVKQLNIERAHQAQLQVDLLNSQNAIQAIAQTGSGGLQVIHNTMWANINTLSTNWANTIAQNVGQALWGVGSLVGVPGGIGGAVGGIFGSSAFKTSVNAEVRNVLGRIYAA